MWIFVLGLAVGLGWGYNIGKHETKKKYKTKQSLQLAVENQPPYTPTAPQLKDCVSSNIY